MATYSSWTVSGASIDYVPIENPVNETVKLFNGKEQGSVPPTTNLSSNTGQYILAQDGTWIPQPSFTSGGSDAFEILRPSVLTPTYSAYTPTVTNSANAYDVDTNHATTFGEWECAFVSRNLPITDTLLFTLFGSKTQTWTSATINISRAYGYFNDGESNSSSKVTSVKVEFSTNGGSSWTTIVTDLSTAVPLTATTSSYTFTTTPTMGNVQVRLTLVRGGGGMIYDPEIGISVPGSTGDIDLRLYDIWISGTYSGGSGNITCNNLTVTGDATFQNKIYDSTASAGTTGQVLKVAANGKVTWATDSAGTGTVTSITTTGANGVTISGGSTQTITTSGTFALALGNITPTSISTGTGSFSGDVAFASSITTPSGSSAPVVIAPDGGGDLHINTDSIRFGYANSNSTLATRGTGDLILTTNENSATEGVIRLYDGANGNITLTPNGTGQVQVGSDQVVTLTASQTLTNKTISGASNTLTNIGNASLSNSTISGVALGSNLFALTISSPLTGTSFNGSSAVSIGIPAATTSVSGYLTSTDWNTFNNKGSGTVTSVSASVPSFLSVSGSPITTSGTLAISYSGTALPVANGGTGLTTLTAGYIPYGNGTSAFGSSANLFWDSSNSRLGIGTSSPATKLEVVGTTGAQFISTFRTGDSTSANNAGGGFYGTSSGTAGTRSAIMWLDADGANFGGNDYFLINKHGSSGVVDIVNASNAAMTFYTNDTERMRITSGGDVLVNATATADSSKLYVAGNLGTNGSQFNFRPGSGTQYELVNRVGAGFDFYVNNAGTLAARLDASGNLGIGTSSPARRLHVVGADNTNPAVIIANSNSNNSILQFGSSGTVYQILGGDYQGNMNISIGGDYPIVFTTNSSEKMRLNSTGLGIGTNSPSEKLTVTGKIKASDVLLGNNGSKGYGAITTATSAPTAGSGASGDHYYVY